MPTWDDAEEQKLLMHFAFESTAPTDFDTLAGARRILHWGRYTVYSLSCDFILRCLPKKALPLFRCSSATAMFCSDFHPLSLFFFAFLSLAFSSVLILPTFAFNFQLITFELLLQRFITQHIPFPSHIISPLIHHAVQVGCLFGTKSSVVCHLCHGEPTGYNLGDRRHESRSWRQPQWQCMRVSRDSFSCFCFVHISGSHSTHF